MEEKKIAAAALPLEIMSDSKHTYMIFGKTGVEVIFNKQDAKRKGV